MHHTVNIEPAKKIKGVFSPPGDKSISHRVLMLGALAEGKTVIRGLLRSHDCLRTWAAIRDMGIEVEEKDGEVIVHGRGLFGLQEAEDVLDMGNSGTSMRLLSGILAGQPFVSVLTGDESLRRRPMARIVDPLRMMGAFILGRQKGKFAPLVIQGGSKLRAMQYTMHQASAQVKSAILLAGLYVRGVIHTVEPAPSRDHTERMLRAMGANIYSEDLAVILEGRPVLRGIEITIPGDFSSAAFYIAAALILPGSDLLIRGVGLNSTRTGLLDAVQEMGGDVEILNQRRAGEEPVGDLRVRASRLRGVTVEGALVPRMIDEFPVFAVLAAMAEGETVIRQAGELRVKESDRISTVAAELRKAGVLIEEFSDGMKILGRGEVRGADFESHGDHRLAMAMAVCALAADTKSRIIDTACVNTSFPVFFHTLEELTIN